MGEVVDVTGNGGEVGGVVTGCRGGEMMVMTVKKEEEEGEEECQGEGEVAVEATDGFSGEASGGGERRERQEGHG